MHNHQRKFWAIRGIGELGSCPTFPIGPAQATAGSLVSGHFRAKWNPGRQGPSFRLKAKGPGQDAGWSAPWILAKATFVAWEQSSFSWGLISVTRVFSGFGTQ